MRNNEKPDQKRTLKAVETKVKGDDLENDVDALFRLPLAEFTGARNELAAKLKKSGRGDAKAEATRVKALAKPSISAWAVNQLYWNHRTEFDRLIASGERFHKAQTSGKIADMRTALDARRETLTQLSDIAGSVLRDSGHSPSPDTLHRVTTTLEGISAHASRSDGPRPGRLTHDVDPPGFESFGSFVPVTGSMKSKEKPQPAAMKDSLRLVPPPVAGGSSRRKVAPEREARQLEETRKAEIAAAKVSLQDAKRSLMKARARAESLAAAQKKAAAEAKKAEKQRREAEEKLAKAKLAAEDAAQRASTIAADFEDAAAAVDDAELTVEKAAKELESLS